METFADAEVIVKKIEGIPNPEKDKPVYLDPNGKPIGNMIQLVKQHVLQQENQLLEYIQN